MRPHDVPDGALLIDTDVISYWLVGAEFGSGFNELVVGHEQAISFATYGEILTIAHKRRWGPQRIEGLRNRLRGFIVVPYSARIVEIWAEMNAKVSGHLHRGGANDLWTAACALALDPPLPIVTNNLKDFQAIATAFPAVQIVHPDS